MRGATRRGSGGRYCGQHFNPHAPCGARRRGGEGAGPARPDFNPHAPCGARLDTVEKVEVTLLFQSTRPMRGATTLQKRDFQLLIFQSTRPMRGATTAHHLPDRSAGNFNPHAPCGARRTWWRILRIPVRFQSTRPMRGATSSTRGSVCISLNFNPHAPCGARHQRRSEQLPYSEFQSTRPMRGATRRPPCRPPESRYFNPHAPCGARQQKYTKLLYTLLRQKAILRQFHAKRRLLKRFSTYKYRNTFLICSANRMGKICTLPLRTTRSLDLPEGMSACSQSARFCFRTFFPSSKTADYPAPDP